jgi:hypothetical protein
MSAIIPINSKYRIELDSFSWQLSKWKPRKSHKYGGRYEGIAWYPTLQQAGESLTRHLVGEDDLEGVDEVIRALHASSALIAAAIKEGPSPDSFSKAKERFDPDND